MDKIIRATAAEGFVKMAVVDARDTVERARAIHACSPTAAAALGRTLCAASRLGDAMKEEKGSLTIRINGGGPIGSVVAVSDTAGNVRGYVENPQLQLPLQANGKLDVGGAVGRDGMLTVSRDLGLKEPYIGSTALVSGEIAEDPTAYLTESEQVPSACALGVLVDTDRTCRAAGGVLIQLLPFADEKVAEQLEKNAASLANISALFDRGLSKKEVADLALAGVDYDVFDELEAGYRCTCSRERMAAALHALGQKELRRMLDEQLAEGKPEELEICCRFCNNKYRFDEKQLKALF